jgi:hypothetical protein
MNPKDAARDAASSKAAEKISRDFKKESGSVASLSTRIKTLEQLLKAAEVDLDVWEVERHIINKWEVGRRNKTVDLEWDEGVMVGNVNDKGNIFVEPLWQVKIWLKRRTAYVEGREWTKKLLAQFAEAAPSLKKIPYAHKDGYLLEVSIPDLHIGKLCWNRETRGRDYDIGIARATFWRAIEELLRRAAPYPIARILYPIGNDFFHVDKQNNTTTAGTVVDADGRWQKSFLVGREMMVKSIERLRQIAPVDVVMVSGNHDEERIFYLGEVLASWFKNAPGVTVDNSPTLRKYYTWGNSLIGFTHGKEEKPKDLPLLMATEMPKEWGASQFREFHLGHWHQKSEMSFKSISEHRGVRVRVLPSLTPPDAWHFRKGYGGLESAEAYLWHPEDGVTGYLAHNVMG